MFFVFTYLMFSQLPITARFYRIIGSIRLSLEFDLDHDCQMQ